MTKIRRLTHSCVIVTDDDHATLIDPDAFSFNSGAVDLETIGDVSRVLITHEHSDHVDPDFVAWLIDRHRDLVVYSNGAVGSILADRGIEVSQDVATGTSIEDVDHEPLPNGLRPPNRAWTIDGTFTHPGDSYAPTTTAPVMSLSLLAPWGSTASSVQFAKRLGPAQVIPAHDWYLSSQGRDFIPGLITGPLAESGIEFVALGWGDSFTV